MQAIGEGLRGGGLEEAKAAWLRHDFFLPRSSTPDLARRLAEMVSDYSGVHWTSPDPHTPHPKQHRAPGNDRRADDRSHRRAGRSLFPRDVRRPGRPDSRRAQTHGSGHRAHINMEAPEAVNALLRELVLDRSLA